jgi:signal transduction histidine kinase
MEENFITMVSHQLRSPLVAIMQYYEVILSGMAGDVPEKQMEIIQKSKARLESLLNLITDWLDVARLDSGQIVDNLKPISAKKIITKVIENLQPLTQEENISLKFGSCGKNDLVQGDADTLEQVFSNLITNAIRYNKPKGNVTVSIKENANYIAVEVQDSGIGIAKEHLPFLFDQFFRVKRGEGQKIKGTGLGLSIAKKIVGAHGGSIQVSSELGKGSTFTVLLPKLKKPK